MTVRGSSERDLPFSFVTAELGLSHLSTRAQVSTLRRLADVDGLPLPKNPRFRSGRRCHNGMSIGRRSVWDRQRFLDWMDDREDEQAVRAERVRDGLPKTDFNLEQMLAERASWQET